MGYKKEIPHSRDWDTDTLDVEINAFRELMKANNENVDEPQLGIFWYDPNKKELFGMRQCLAKDVPFSESDYFKGNVRTCSPMHYQVWSKEYHRKKDRRFSSPNFTLIPRGRIFEEEGKGFFVCVGSWINKYPQARELILDEFDLPSDTEFRVDSHWDIGHGWSDKDF